MLKRIFILSALLLLAGCENNKFDPKSLDDNSLFAAKNIALSAGKVKVKSGMARCFFGDMDAATLDTKSMGRKNFLFTIEKISPQATKHRTLFSKTVTEKNFTSGFNISIKKVPNGVYGIFLCSSSNRRSCINESQPNIANVNQVIANQISKNVTNTEKEKVYSANFFIKYDNYLLGPQKNEGLDVIGGEFQKMISLVADEKAAAPMWSFMEPFYDAIFPNPIFKAMNPDEVKNKDDIVIEIPTMDKEACDTKTLLDVYKRNKE